jgi:hypothetical protein
MLEDELICTTVAFGYGGEAVSGKLTKRGRPRRRWIIDLIACEYVVRIFRWFVDNGESIEEIVRRLNDIPGVPLPPKSKGKWSRTAVMRVLTNDVYLGILKYGDFESTDTPSKNYVVRKRRSAPLLVKHVERLRIMDDATWLAAQKILLSHPGRGGRKRKDGQPSPTSILQKLFYCPKHSFLYVGGAHGKYLYCRKCRQSPAKKRVLYTQLNCSTALSVTLRALAHSLKSDADLVNRIVEACTAAAKQSQTADPKQVDRLKARDKKVAAAITFAKENPGDSPEEQTETRQLLQRLRAQRLEIQSELAELAKAIKSARIPAESEVRDMIARLETVLLSAATSADRDQIRRCRQLVRLLTGGRITLQQCGEATPKAGWLEGTFQLQLLPTLLKELGQQRAESGTAPAVELSFRRVESFAGEAEEAFTLFQQEWPECNIAGKLGCSRSRITKLLKYEYARRGLVKPDGRSRRKPSSNNPPRFQQIANDVKLKVEAGHSNRAIGRQLNVSDTTVEKAFRWWFESRGLKAPTVKERRESSIVRAIEMIEAGATLKATAAKLGYSPRGLKLRIADYLSEHNRPAIDFRSHWPGKGTMPPDTHGQIPDVA